MLSDSFEFPLEANDTMVKIPFSTVSFDWPFKSAAGRSKKRLQGRFFISPVTYVPYISRLRFKGNWGLF